MHWLRERQAELAAAARGHDPAPHHRVRLSRPQLSGAARARRRPSAAPPRPNQPRQRLWRVRAKQVVLATGAIERPLVFRGNDRPGVMLASAARTYLNRYAVRPGSRVVVFTNNDSAYAAALDLRPAGVAIEAIVDLRARTDGALPAVAAAAGLPIRRGSAVVATDGRLRVNRVWVSPLRADGSRGPGEPSGPALRLPARLGRLEPDRAPVLAVARQAAVRRASCRFVPEPVRPAGALGRCLPTVACALAACFAEGAQGRCAKPPGTPASRRPSRRTARGPRARGRAAAADLGGAEPRRPIARQGLRRLPERRHRQGPGPGRARGLPVDRARQALHHHRHGHRPGQDQQRQRAGDRGRQARASRSRRSAPPPSACPTRRSPFGALAGPHGGELFDPIRRTPSHAWATAQGAVFEDVGNWKRARYFPRAGEDMHAAVQRECLRGAAGCRPVRRQHAGQDRPAGPGQRRVPQPRLHQRLDQARGRPLPLRPDAARRRHGVRRRRHRPAGPGPFPHDHDHRRRGARPGLAGGVAADRVAGARGLLHLGHRAVGGAGRGRAEGARGAARGRHGSRPRQRRLCRIWRSRKARSPASRRGCSGSASPARSPTRSTCPGAMAPRSGRRCGRRASRSASRPTAPRACTCCAPRRATSSSARTRTAP